MNPEHETEAVFKNPIPEAEAVLKNRNQTGICNRDDIIRLESTLNLKLRRYSKTGINPIPEAEAVFKSRNQP